MRRLILSLFVFAAFSGVALASNQNPATCSDANMVSAFAGATSDGDIITVPAGNCDITTPWNITHGITINCHVGRDTVFSDKASHAAATLKFNSSANWTMKHCKFVQGNDAPPTNPTQWFVEIDNTASHWDMDDVQFGADVSHPLSAVRIIRNVDGCNYGILHNSTIYTYNQTFLVGEKDCGGGDYGNYTWSTDSNFGSASGQVLMENNILASSGAVSNASVFDALDGGRFTARMNTITNMLFVPHGTESGQQERGIRQCEIYGNAMDSSALGGGDSPAILYTRSGTCFVHHNTTVGYISAIYGINFRASNDYPPWHGSDDAAAAIGDSPYDNLDATIFATGTHTGSNGVSLVLTDSGGSFTTYAPTRNALIGATGEFVGGKNYSICNTTRHWCTYILSSTGTTITGAGADALGTDVCARCTGGHMTWSTGDTYTVRNVTAVLDGIGRGKGILLTSGGAGVHPTPIQWAGNTLEPMYAWDNSMTNIDGVTPSTNHDPFVQNGRDIITDKPTSPNKVHTSGTSLPVSCTAPTDWFWKTNGTNWNDGSNANYTGDGDGYQCLTTNTWTKVYTPTNYPYSASGSCTADHLSFSDQPASAVIGVSLGGVTVGIYDASAVHCDSATNTITIANKGGTCTGMTLDGTKSAAASGGDFITSDLSESVATGGCTLTATASGLTSADSSSFTITAAPGTGPGRLRLR